MSLGFLPLAILVDRLISRISHACTLCSGKNAAEDDFHINNIVVIVWLVKCWTEWEKKIQLQFYGGRASVCMAKKGWIESVPSCNVVAVRSFTRSVNWKSIQFALFEHYIMLMRNNIQILPNIPG